MYPIDGAKYMNNNQMCKCETLLMNKTSANKFN